MPAVGLVRGKGDGLDKLEQLAKGVKACTNCELRMNATRPVPGIGEVGSNYFLIGEAPGANEDKVGIPFIGDAGKKLDQLLELAGIDRNDCYFTNVCKCRPPSNRDPRKGEIKACKIWLEEEIRLVKPAYIITLGRVPLSLFSEYGVKQMHGTMFEMEVEDGID